MGLDGDFKNGPRKGGGGGNWGGQNGGGDRRSRKGVYDRYWPPRITPELQGKMRPSETVAEDVCFIPGAYPDIYAQTTPPPLERDYRTVIHKIKVKQKFEDIVCSAGPDYHAPKPCVLCYLHDRGDDGIKRVTSWSLTLAHFAIYHEGPWHKDGKLMTDRDKKPVININECRTYKRLSQLLNQRCDHCEANVPFRFGARRYLSVGAGQYENLQDWHKEAKKECANCGTRCVEVGFDCRFCHNILIDFATTQLTMEQLQQYSETEVGCPACQAKGLPQKAYDCGYNADGTVKMQGLGCDSDTIPTPRSLFDYVYSVMREGEGRDSKLVYTKKTLKSQYKVLVGTPNEQFLTEHVLSGIVEGPYDFPTMLAPLSTAEQARLLNVPDPYASQSNGPPSAPAQSFAQNPGRPAAGPPPGIALPTRPDFR